MAGTVSMGDNTTTRVSSLMKSSDVKKEQIHYRVDRTQQEFNEESEECIKLLRWLISVFIEASNVQGKSYNENGRYVSFIVIEGQNKAVTITPESSYKGGWGNIAHKIAKITYEPTTEQKVLLNKGKPLGTSFREAIRNSRWTTESTKKVHLQVEGASIRVTNETPTSERPSQ
ncbi:hypothetical protein H5410_030430 [Solanum commersonii]|uniref:Uncharacterized protein n=1 Tax=Solanum commersonii TaxID=4109 RepID=A0A9J5YIN1_SOLCO|nr:hypothetical protein H5410_030430 [Solanum commersonii]